MYWSFIAAVLVIIYFGARLATTVLGYFGVPEISSSSLKSLIANWFTFGISLGGWYVARDYFQRNVWYRKLDWFDQEVNDQNEENIV